LEYLLPPKDHQARLTELLWATDEDVETIDVMVIRSTEFSDFGKICFDKLESMPVTLSQ